MAFFYPVPNSIVYDQKLSDGLKDMHLCLFSKYFELNFLNFLHMCAIEQNERMINVKSMFAVDAEESKFTLELKRMYVKFIGTATCISNVLSFNRCVFIPENDEVNLSILANKNDTGPELYLRDCSVDYPFHIDSNFSAVSFDKINGGGSIHLQDTLS